MVRALWRRNPFCSLSLIEWAVSTWSWYSKCLSEDLKIPTGSLHKPFAFSRPRAWINNKCIFAGVSLQTYPRQMPTCSDIKCPKCHRPKLKRVVFSLSLSFFSSSSFIFFLAWLSITSVIHTAAGWTGTLYNLANTTVVLRGTAQRSSQIFMSQNLPPPPDSPPAKGQKVWAGALERECSLPTLNIP